MISGYHVLGATASPQVDSPAAPAPRDEIAMRQAAVQFLVDRRGTPYLWGGKDPDKGLDCEGAVGAAWEAAGIVPRGTMKRYTSSDLHKAVECIDETDAQPGDAVFYGRNGVSHVMLIVGDGRVIGATGGDRTTTSIAAARERHAEVKYEPVHYRKDVVSFGKAPVDGRLGIGTPDAPPSRAATIGYGIAATIFAAIGAWWVHWFKARSAA